MSFTCSPCPITAGHSWSSDGLGDDVLKCTGYAQLKLSTRLVPPLRYVLSKKS